MWIPQTISWMSETEKITVNLSVVDLGKIDLLVDEGLYAGRTDFVRASVRAQLDKHQTEVVQAVTRSRFVVGVVVYGRAALERAKADHARLKFTVVGLLKLTDDVPVELAAETIESIRVKGAFRARPELKAALAGRML